MNTVIVPVDFQETSLHAATYAAQLISGHLDVTLILYHSYSKDSEEAASLETLEMIKAKLNEKFTTVIEILNHKVDDFTEGLEKAVRHRGANLVVMGITSRSTLGQVFIGSHSYKFAELKVCPVLIVPDFAFFRDVNNVMLASDFKNTHNVTPSVPIKDFLRLFKPKLHIVNVDQSHYVSLSEQHENEKSQLSEMFGEFNPEFYFLRMYDVDEALNLFAEEKHIDLIISIKHNHTFIEKLFKRSHTKHLSYQSHVPILVVHE